MGQKKSGWIIPLALFVITLLTRLPFTSKLLYNLDSVDFALAVEKYDIYLNQPHPPGYFLYVMTGKLIHLFLPDANTSYLVISILFSGFTAVAVYYLGCALFDEEAGLWAALLALTSPSLWFHGEVALTYIVEAFFSVYLAYLCWKMLQGDQRPLWYSAVVLGVAGGFRPQTLLFLLPLWIVSLKGFPFRRKIGAVLLLGCVVIAWFVPMIFATGGMTNFFSALRDQWDFFLRPGTVFATGFAKRALVIEAILRYLLYSIGLGVFIMGLHLYSVIRKGRWFSVSSDKMLFFLVWLSPTFIFYLLLLISIVHPGHALIFMPAFFILLPLSARHVAMELQRLFPHLRTSLASYFLVFLLVTNTLFFLLLPWPVSAQAIRVHDENLSTILQGIENHFSPQETIVLNTRPYFEYSFKHALYYLHDFRAYLIDPRKNKRGEQQNMFWGINRQTIRSQSIVIPKSIKNFVVLYDPSDEKHLKELLSDGLTLIPLGKGLVLPYGEIRQAPLINRDVVFRFEDEKAR